MARFSNLLLASTLLSIDLSSDFEPDTVSFGSIAKPAGVPDLNRAGIWVDQTSGLLYTGFAGLTSDFGDAPIVAQGLWSFEPSADGATGTWTNLNDTTDEYFTTQPRHFAGPVASGNGTGYFLGGKSITPSCVHILGGQRIARARALARVNIRSRC